MVTHTLKCSVCGGEFHSKQHWNDHLLTPSHQEQAWRECVSSWWMNNSLRCCCLVVFTSCPVTPSFAREIVDYFGNKLSRRFLTDFVYLEGNRFVAVQFESKIVVETVLTENPDRSGIIGGNVIQMKKLSDLLELEWQHLNQNYSNLIETPPKVSNCHLKLKDFHWIRSCTEVSVENWENFQKLMNHAKVAFNLPELFVFGNYAQRIFFFGMRDPRFFICNFDASKKLFTPQTVPISKSGSHPKLRQFKFEEKNLPANWFSWRRGKHHFRFTFIDDFICIREVQMFRLLDYLCQFDSRLNGVLVLVAFWSRPHKISLSGRGTKYFCSNPTILQWMIVLFLAKVGVIPSPKQIKNHLRPNRTFYGGTKRNMAPAFSTKFTEQETEVVSIWKKSSETFEINTSAWLESVIKLTRDLFKFYSSNLKSHSWILNPESGEMWTRAELKSAKGTKPHIHGFHNLEERISMINPTNLDSKLRLPFSVELWDKNVCGQMEEAARRLDQYLAGNETWSDLAHALAGSSLHKEKIRTWIKNWNILGEIVR